MEYERVGTRDVACRPDYSRATGKGRCTNSFSFLLRYFSSHLLAIQDVSWLPSDVVARSLIEMTYAPSSVYNVVNPNPGRWNAIFGTFARALDLPMIPYSDWVKQVAEAASSSTGFEDASALSLADFFNSNEGVASRLSEGPR